MLNGYREIHDSDRVSSELKLADKRQSTLLTKVYHHPRSNNQSPLNMISELDKRSKSYLAHADHSVMSNDTPQLS